MSGYQSPLGNKQMRNSNMKSYDVPDLSELQKFAQQMDESDSWQSEQYEPSPQERELLEARRLKASGKEKLNDSARKRIEILLNMQRLTKEVPIDSEVFVIRNLNNRESKKCIIEASQHNLKFEFDEELKLQTLARAIVSISNIDLSSFLGSNSLQDRISFLDELDPAIVDRLFKEYSIIAQEMSDKYSLKNEKDAKEVLEDLKK